MYAQSVLPTWRRGFVAAILGALTARPAAALLTTPVLHLLKNTVPITPDLAVATLAAAEADFTGYTAAAIASWSGPLNLVPLTDGLLQNSIFTVGSSPTTTNNIVGYYVDENTGADWVIAELFPNAIPMAFAGDFIDLAVALGIALNPQTE